MYALEPTEHPSATNRPAPIRLRRIELHITLKPREDVVVPTSAGYLHGTEVSCDRVSTEKGYAVSIDDTYTTLDALPPTSASKLWMPSATRHRTESLCMLTVSLIAALKLCRHGKPVDKPPEYDVAVLHDDPGKGSNESHRQDVEDHTCETEIFRQATSQTEELRDE